MNWVKKRKLPATEAIKYNVLPCLFPDSLWNALHNSFNTALHHWVNFDILNEVEHKPCQVWNSFSRYEFRSAIHKCVDTSAPGVKIVDGGLYFIFSFHFILFFYF